MSLVTGVVVYVPHHTTDTDASPEERALHNYLVGPVRPDGSGDGAQHLAPLPDGHAGGHKWIGGTVYAAGFNYIPVDDVVAFLAAAPWADSDPVAVIDYEHDDAPRVWRP